MNIFERINGVQSEEKLEAMVQQVAIDRGQSLREGETYHDAAVRFAQHDTYLSNVMVSARDRGLELQVERQGYGL